MTDGPKPGEPMVQMLASLAMAQATVTALLEVFINRAPPDMASMIVNRIKEHHAKATAGYPEVVKQEAAAVLAGFLHQLASQLPNLPADDKPKAN